ncbi:Sapep family Mn(2+)-dependent dipeptidase [Peribacillus loiseleuriae]|uniref:Sapep family Mn(2+)-dependent dipeptidase n=1 Tax=Peribacillus loiseleuriae TaxID=1679170 RepID=UPI00381327F6
MNNFIQFYYEKLQFYEEQLMEDLAELVSIRSVRDETTITNHAPFGRTIRDAFDQMKSIAERDRFLHEDFDGYAVHLEHGSGDEIIGILGHLDIVPEGDKEDWTFDPFTLTEHDGYLYGRGVNDDKAPLLAAYYAMKILRDLNIPLKRKVRLIVGGAEETTWECIDHYFKYNRQPVMAFSSDGDFPIVNGEKGVVQGSFTLNNEHPSMNKSPHLLLEIQSEKQRGYICEKCIAIFESSSPESLKNLLLEADEVIISNQTVTAFYKGEKTLSRNPQKGQSGFFKCSKDLVGIREGIRNAEEFIRLLETFFLEDVYGKKMGLFHEDQEMGISTMGIPYVVYDGDHFEVAFDYRFPKGQTLDLAIETLQSFSDQNHLDLIIHKTHDLLYVEPDSKLIRTLQQAYIAVIGENAGCITKGGISYARALENGVAFGPTFIGDHPNTHKPNERIRIETLYKAIIIYCETLRLLAS